MLTLLKERGIEVSNQILPTLSILLKKDKQGVTYLQYLKDVLLSEIHGLDHLKDIGISLPGVNSWEEHNISGAERALVTLNYSVAKALSVLQGTFDSLEVKLSSNQIQLIKPVYNPINKTWFTPGPWDAPSYISKGGDNANSKTIFELASLKAIQPKGWGYDFPHPSAIASIYHLNLCLLLMAKGVNDLIKDFKSPEEIINDFVQEIGYSLKAISPKEASSFILKQSDKTDYYRNKVLLSHKLLKALQEKKRSGQDLIVFSDIRCEFRLPKPDDPFNANLLIRRLTVEGQTEDRLVTWYMSQILKGKPLIIKDDVTPNDPNDEDGDPEWMTIYNVK